MDNHVIELLSPFNGETVRIYAEECGPVMLAAMIQAGFVHLNAPKGKQKEKSNGANQTDGRGPAQDQAGCDRVLSGVQPGTESGEF